MNQEWYDVVSQLVWNATRPRPTTLRAAGAWPVRHWCTAQIIYTLFIGLKVLDGAHRLPGWLQASWGANTLLVGLKDAVDKQPETARGLVSAARCAAAAWRASLRSLMAKF
jgi:hypothetical protein